MRLTAPASTVKRGSNQKITELDAERDKRLEVVRHDTGKRVGDQGAGGDTRDRHDRKAIRLQS